jgi:hypothetical protein
MNLSDITASEYLAANDYKVGTTFPPKEIVRISMADIGVPGKSSKQSKCVVFLKDVPKGWVINKQEARKIGAALDCVTGIEKGWLGALVSLTIVGDVRRPDGTRGNAIRIHEVKPAAFAPNAPTTAKE